MYELITGRRVWEEPWPEADPALLATDEIELVVQLNGKLVDRLRAPAEATEGELEELARASEKLARAARRQGDRQGRGGARQARELRGPVSRAERARSRSGPLVGTLGRDDARSVSLFLDWYEDITGFTVFEALDLCCVALAVATASRSQGRPASACRAPPVVRARAAARRGRRSLIVVSQLLNDPPLGGRRGRAGARDSASGSRSAGAALMIVGALRRGLRAISLAVDVRRRAARRRGPRPEADERQPEEA